MVLLFFSNCKKPPTEIQGIATATKNGTEWEGKCISGYDNQYPDELFFDITTYSPEGFRRESFGIFRIDQIGTFNVTLPLRDSIGMMLNKYWSSYSTLIDDGDVLGDLYKVLESEKNTVEITTIDYESMIITGKFNISYINTYDTIPAPDTIRFENGEFQAKIENWE